MGEERIPVSNQSSGGLGILGLIGAAVLFLILRRFSPSLSRLFLIIGIIAISCVLVLVALVLYFAFRKPKKKPDSASDRAVLLQKGRSDLLELRQLTLRIHDQRIRKSGEEVCQVVEKILAALKEQPEDIPKARQLFSYYLLTFSGILQRYARLEQSGVPVADDAEKVAVCLDGIQVAMRKMYDSLYDDDKLDLTVEIETLKQICRQDGLLAEDVVQIEDGEQNITLSL